MAFMTWTDNLVTGNPVIDAQHRGLMDVLNQLHAAMSQGQGNTALVPLFDGLVQSAGDHFQTEESLFSGLDYSEKELHIDEHQGLLKQIIDLRSKLTAGNLVVSEEVLDFLKSWLINHVLEMDMGLKGRI